MSKVNEYADAVIRLITEDARTGKVPGNVTSFSQLHDHVDANMYFEQVGQQYHPESQRTVDEANAVEDAVSARLAAGELMKDTRAGLIDMGAVTAELIKLGIHAECGNSGGNVQTIYAGTLDVDKYGDQRHAVLAGPGYLDTVNGRVVQIGYTGEWVFGVDDDGESDVYSPRTDVAETPAQLAARIAELVRLVQAKRDERQAELDKIGDGEDGEGVSEALSIFWDHVTQKVFPGIHQGDNDTLTEGALQQAAHAAVRAWLLRNFDMTVTLPEPAPRTTSLPCPASVATVPIPGRTGLVSPDVNTTAFRALVSGVVRSELAEHGTPLHLVAYAGADGRGNVLQLTGYAVAVDREHIAMQDGTLIRLDELVSVYLDL